MSEIPLKLAIHLSREKSIRFLPNELASKDSNSFSNKYTTTEGTERFDSGGMVVEVVQVVEVVVRVPAEHDGANNTENPLHLPAFSIVNEHV